MPWEGLSKRRQEEVSESVPEDTSRDLSEDEEILAWRMLSLLDAGYSATNAGALAACKYVDTHAAARLLARGCDQETAVKILL